MEQLLFYLFAALTIVGAFLVIWLPNPVRGAMSLVATLFCVAVLFVLLDAHLVAVLEILVYAGAVMVLFLFVIMLLNLREEELGRREHAIFKLLGAAAAILIGTMLWRAVGAELPRADLASDFGTIEVVGRLLLKDYLLAFELTSVLLLVAVVGAVMVAKRRV